MKVLGRNLRDFLNGLDNLHEYLKHSYPKLRPPSFFVDNETPNGLRLHYRSKRNGYMHYVKGQIKEVKFIKDIITIVLSYFCDSLQNKLHQNLKTSSVKKC